MTRLSLNKLFEGTLSGLCVNYISEQIIRITYGADNSSVIGLGVEHNHTDLMRNYVSTNYEHD